MERELTRAKNVAIRFLSYRPRSLGEVTTKLKAKKFSNEIIQQTIEFLLNYKYIDDVQFTKDWIRHRNIIKPMGRKRLVQELHQKGIDDAIINKEINHISDEDEIILIIDILNKKINKGNENDLLKLQGKLLRRGFSNNLIKKAF